MVKHQAESAVTGAVGDVGAAIKYDPDDDEYDTSIKANVLARYFALASSFSENTSHSSTLSLHSLHEATLTGPYHRAECLGVALTPCRAVSIELCPQPCAATTAMIF